MTGENPALFSDRRTRHISPPEPRTNPRRSPTFVFLFFPLRNIASKGRHALIRMGRRKKTGFFQTYLNFSKNNNYTKFPHLLLLMVMSKSKSLVNPSQLVLCCSVLRKQKDDHFLLPFPNPRLLVKNRRTEEGASKKKRSIWLCSLSPPLTRVSEWFACPLKRTLPPTKQERKFVCRFSSRTTRRRQYYCLFSPLPLFDFPYFNRRL